MNRPFNVPIALPRGPEHYWKVAVGYGAKGFMLGELAGCTNGVAYQTVKTWLYAMVEAGAIKQIGARKSSGGLPAHIYAVAIRTAKPPVRRRPEYTGARGRIQQQLWTAMRTLGTFTTVELAAAASTDTLVINQRTAEAYIRKLARVGVLLVVEPYAKGKPGRTGARAGAWRLKKSANTGPLAPKIFKAEIVFDSNRAEIIGESEVSL